MEAMLINPRRKRRKHVNAHRRSRKRRRVHARARHNPVRHRRRRITARRGRRRVHRNPSFGGLKSGLMGAAKTGLGIAIGAIATQLGTAAIVNNVPGIPENFKTGLGRTAIKGVIGGIGLPMLFKAVGQKELARNTAIAAWTLVALDLYAEYVQAHLPAQLQDYEAMGVYESGIAGEFPSEGEASGGMGYGENMYADTMY